MRVFYDEQVLYSSGMVSNTGNIHLSFGPGTSTHIKVVVNAKGNPDPETAWYYDLTASASQPAFFTLTEDTNYTTLPVKFAVPPFDGPLVSAAPGEPCNRIFYQPEQPLDILNGENASGEWKLEVRDTRPGPGGAPAVLLDWQLRLALVSSEPVPLPLVDGAAVSGTIPPGQLQWFKVQVPGWAERATNVLVSAGAPLDLFFNALQPPTSTNAGDLLLLPGSLGGRSTLYKGGSPPLPVGAGYYLALRNTNAVPVAFGFRVDFGVPELASGISVTTSVSGEQIRYFAFDVSEAATSVAFEARQSDGDVTLLASHGLPMPTLAQRDAASSNPGTNDEAILLFPGSALVLAPGRWYLALLSASGSPVTCRVSATEFTNVFPALQKLQSGEAFSGSNAGPSLSADYYHFVVSPAAARAQFELTGLSAPAALVVRKGLPLPTLDDWDLFSDKPGTNEEVIVIHNYSQPVPLSPGDWFLAAINLSGQGLQYTTKATEYYEHGTQISIQPPVVDSQGFCLTWNSLPGTRYHVEGTPGLPGSSWVPVSPTLTAPGPETTWCVPLPSACRFFRVSEGPAPEP
jgi:hypothetical protein